MADNPMLKFVGLGQAYPDKRAADDRADDFLEISRSFILDRAEDVEAQPVIIGFGNLLHVTGEDVDHFVEDLRCVVATGAHSDRNPGVGHRV